MPTMVWDALLQNRLCTGVQIDLKMYVYYVRLYSGPLQRIDLPHTLSCSGASALHSLALPCLSNRGPFSAQIQLPLTWGSDRIVPITCLLFLWFCSCCFPHLESRPCSHPSIHTNTLVVDTIPSPPQILWPHSIQGLSDTKSQGFLAVSGGKSCVSEQAGSPAGAKYFLVSPLCLPQCLTQTGLNKCFYSRCLYSFFLSQHPVVSMTRWQLAEERLKMCEWTLCLLHKSVLNSWDIQSSVTHMWEA